MKMDNFDWVLLLIMMIVISFVIGIGIERQRNTVSVSYAIKETNKEWGNRFRALIRNSSIDCVRGMKEIMDAYDDGELPDDKE